MPDRYQAAGGVGGRLPGVIGPDELDGRLDWAPLRPPRDLPEAIALRLGSEDQAQRSILGVLAPLREPLDGEPLRALAAVLPLDLARELIDAEQSLCTRIAPPSGAAEYLAEVSRLLLRPADVAATYVRAVFGAAKALLSREVVGAVEARLPPGVAEIWREAC